MKSNFLYILTLTSFLFIFSNCSGDDDTSAEEICVSSNVISCCEIPHLEACVGGAKFYVSNAFTPNGDGINDIFYPHTALDGKGIQTINSFIVSTLDDEVVHSKMNYPSPFPIEAGWDGTQTDGTRVDGVYKYTIEVTNIASETFSFAGHVCSRSTSPRPCEDFERHCTYPTQHNGGGKFDRFQPTLEPPCQ